MRPLFDLMGPAAFISIAVLRRRRQDDLQGALRRLGGTVLRRVAEAQRDPGGESGLAEGANLVRNGEKNVFIKTSLVSCLSVDLKSR